MVGFKGKQGRRARITLINELFNLGFTSRQIADYLGLSVVTIHADLRKALGGARNFPQRPLRQSEVFQAIVTRYAKLVLEWSEKSYPHDRERLFLQNTLGDWLGVEDCRKTLNVLFKFKTPMFSSSTDQGCYELTCELFGRKSVSPGDEAEAFLYRYFLDIARGKISLPGVSLVENLARRFHKECHADFLLPWPAKATEIITAEIEQLDDRRKKVIKGLFGIDRERMTKSEIGKRLGVSREWVQQLYESALSILKKPTRLGFLKWPVSPAGAVSNEVLQRAIEEKEEYFRKLAGDTSVSMPVPSPAISTRVIRKLFLRVDDYCLFSTRTTNCFRLVGIQLLGEVAILTAGELCKLRGIGKVSFREVKDTLQGMGLELGMELPPDLTKKLASFKQR